MADTGSRPHAFALTRLSLTIFVGVWPFFWLPSVHPRDDLSPWTSVIAVAVVAALLGLWLVRFILRRRRAKRRLSDSPLHRLHGWVESVDEVDFFEAPGVQDYPLWRGTVADRLMRLIGRPLGKRAEALLGVAFLTYVIAAFVILLTGFLAPSFAEITWNVAFAEMGVTLWSTIPVLGWIMAALDLRRWAARTFRQIEQPQTT